MSFYRFLSFFLTAIDIYVIEKHFSVCVPKVPFQGSVSQIFKLYIKNDN